MILYWVQSNKGSGAARRGESAERSIGNRVRGPNGTAAVYAESPHRMAQATHRETGKGMRDRRDRERP